MLVRKRDGRLEELSVGKVAAGLDRAARETGEMPPGAARKFAAGVVRRFIEPRFPAGAEPPTVEDIQDAMEEALLLSPHRRTAKAYIIHREQQARLREINEAMSVAMVDGYLDRADWRVNENSNMDYSLQGLNNHLSSELSKTYWLRAVYPPPVREAHSSGDIHLHDLGLIAPYCVGWDLQDLLLSGFGGVPGKVRSAPARHLRSALGQVVNFFYTLQGEAAGAQAFSNFDTLLAPFIRYDGLDYAGVKQALQEFVYNINVPTRVGFQCLSEDTEILTPRGWAGHGDVREGDEICTFNTATGAVEVMRVDHVFARRYSGRMYRLRNRTQDQLVSPGHRVVRKRFNAPGYVLDPVEAVASARSPVPVPTCGDFAGADYPVPDDRLKLMALIMADGSIEKNGSHRVTIYQNREKHPGVYREIIGLLGRLGLRYREAPSGGGRGKCTGIRLDAEASREAAAWFGGPEKLWPPYLYALSARQAGLFIEWYLRGDGNREKGRIRIPTTRKDYADGLMALGVLAGYSVSCRLRGAASLGPHNRRDLHVVCLTRSRCDYIRDISQTGYEGVIWSVHTANETVIARRAGAVFITGNTPFTNVTLDIRPPAHLAGQHAVVGGEARPETYGEFQAEMDLFNRAFFDVMASGDAAGRVFTFPIPTCNITRDFDWDNPVLEGLWELTAKYGAPYFSNYVTSGMDPGDSRSMCCRLRLDTGELRRRAGGVFAAGALTGSVGVVTINLPRLGCLARDEAEFLELLRGRMEIARDSLEIKRRQVELRTARGLYPYCRFYLRGVQERFGSFWANHFSTIGVIGMHEACLNLLGRGIETEAGRAFALRVLTYMRGVIGEFQARTGNLYNLEATPAEGACYSLAQKDVRKHPAARFSGGPGAEYYTNSTQLPVGHTGDLFEALDHQEALQGLYTGGTVFHAFLGERIPAAAVPLLVRRVFSRYSIPYLTLTPTFSVCPDHGYIPGERPACPACGGETEVYSRIVGYLRPVKQWNAGKKREFRDRRVFAAEVSHG